MNCVPLPETSYCHQSDKSDVHFQSQRLETWQEVRATFEEVGEGGVLMCAKDEVFSSAGYSRCAGLARLGSGVIFL